MRQCDWTSLQPWCLWGPGPRPQRRDRTPGTCGDGRWPRRWHSWPPAGGLPSSGRHRRLGLAGLRRTSAWIPGWTAVPRNRQRPGGERLLAPGGRGSGRSRHPVWMGSIGFYLDQLRCHRGRLETLKMWIQQFEFFKSINSIVIKRMCLQINVFSLLKYHNLWYLSQCHSMCWLS